MGVSVPAPGTNVCALAAGTFNSSCNPSWMFEIIVELIIGRLLARATIVKYPMPLRFAAALLLLPSLAVGQTPQKTHISPAQAAELFRSVDTILRFDAQDTGLHVHHAVKRRLMTREQVVAFLKQKMDEDKDTARVERSAIVLEKFGLLPNGFALRPFLLKLLGEQVAGFYDSKTKTVNLLDWIDADTQKPVLAHELAHALQDQYQTARGVDLDKWENFGPEGTAHNLEEDREHLATDEADSAREAALEGQAMVAYIDWGLNGKGQTLRTLPDIGPQMLGDGSDADSPVLASAPLVLKESLLFPYQEGMQFEQRILKTQGTEAAFAGVLTRPPGTSWEILHPEDYERKVAPPLLVLPDLHPLLDSAYAPYDVGVLGALDVRILGQALADPGAGADLALAWDGGVYYAAQARSAANKNDPGSLALVYLSRWKTPAAAHQFATVYRGSLTRRFVKLEPGAHTAMRTVDMTEDGPVLIEQQDRSVFVSQSLPLSIAEEAMRLMLAAQTEAAARAPGTVSLSAPLRRFFAAQGLFRAGYTSR